MTDHPWIKSCPAGVTWDTPLPLAPVQSLLDDTVARWPDNPALDFMGRVIDFLVTLDMVALYPQMARLLGDSRLKKLIVGNLGNYSAQLAAVRAQLQGAGQLSPVPSDDRHLTGARVRVAARPDRRTRVEGAGRGGCGGATSQRGRRAGSEDERGHSAGRREEAVRCPRAAGQGGRAAAARRHVKRAAPRARVRSHAS